MALICLRINCILTNIWSVPWHWPSVQKIILHNNVALISTSDGPNNCIFRLLGCEELIVIGKLIMEVDYLLRGNIYPGGFSVHTPVVLVNLLCNASYKLGKPRVLKSHDIFAIFDRNVWKQWMYLLWLTDWVMDWQHLLNKDSFKNFHYPRPPLAPTGIVFVSAICLSVCHSWKMLLV